MRWFGNNMEATLEEWEIERVRPARASAVIQVEGARPQSRRSNEGGKHV